MAVALLTEDQIAQIVERVVRKIIGDVRTSSSDLLDTYQAAEVAKRREKTVREWCRSNALKAKKRGRTWVIRRDDLDRFMAGQPVDDGFLDDALRRIR